MSSETPKTPTPNGQEFATKAARFYPVHAQSVRALSTPIVTATTFQLADVEHGARLTGKPDKTQNDEDGFIYSRWANPTVQLAAQCISQLEDCEGTLLFSSGMNAITSALLTFLSSGDHLVCARGCYGGVHEFVGNFFQKYNIGVTFVDANDVNNFEAAIQPNTRVLYAETPCNPTMRLTDLYTLGQISKKAKTILIVDGTFGTPYHTKTLSIEGVDISLHACTKYMGGHSDLTAGCISSNNIELLTSVAKTQRLFGGILSPFDAMLLMRGLKTLDVRMERHAANALKIAKWLSAHPMVDAVHYPGLDTHPDYKLACKMMNNGFGGMISFEIKGGLEEGKAFVQNLKLINLAVSLGSVESLICHSASTTHLMVPRETRLASGISDGLVRFSVGLEHADDLIADMDRGFAVISKSN